MGAISKCGDAMMRTMLFEAAQAQLQTPPPDFRADKAGEVISPLAPIEAGTAKDSAVARF
jgi:hypothetical protein